MPLVGFSVLLNTGLHVDFIVVFTACVLKSMMMMMVMMMMKDICPVKTSVPAFQQFLKVHLSALGLIWNRSKSAKNWPVERIKSKGPV